jgi:hypothetical protein
VQEEHERSLDAPNILEENHDLDDPSQTKWEKQFQQLLLFRTKHNTFALNKAIAGPTLCSWAKRQRYLYRNTFSGAARRSGEDVPGSERNKVLSQVKYERLCNIGFPFPDIKGEKGQVLTTTLKFRSPSVTAVFL